MKKMLPLILVIAVLSCSRLNAQNISGNRKGALNVNSGLRKIIESQSPVQADGRRLYPMQVTVSSPPTMPISFWR
jgi:hypothetical protein